MDMMKQNAHIVRLTDKLMQLRTFGCVKMKVFKVLIITQP